MICWRSWSARRRTSSRSNSVDSDQPVNSINSSPHLGPLRTRRAAQSFSLRSRRQHKARGVSPGNESRKIFRAREASDSGNLRFALGVSWYRRSERDNSAARLCGLMTIIGSNLGFRCSTPGFTLSPAPAGWSVFSTDFIDRIRKRSCQISQGSFHLGYAVIDDVPNGRVTC